MKKPIITVITTARNMEPWIAETIQSIKNQSLEDWECIVSDDGSTDGTARAVEVAADGDSRIRVIHHEHVGISASRNLAAKEAKGKYLIGLDADDLLAPDLLEKAVDYLEAHRSCSMYLCREWRFDGSDLEGGHEGTHIGWDANGYLRLLQDNHIHASAVYRKEDFDRVGGYRTEMEAYEDWELWLRLLWGNDNVYFDVDGTFGYYYRQRQGSMRRWGEKRDAELRARIRELNPQIYKEPYPMEQKWNVPDILPGELTKETLVVIPYLAAGAQGRELEYAVEGWRKHCKDPYRLVIVGDYPAFLDDNPTDVSFIHCPRVAEVEGQYTPHLDMVNKFLRVKEYFPETDGFVYACDDMYAISDFTFADVKAVKTNTDRFLGNALSLNGWQRDLAKTAEICDTEGLPRRGYVCHLPVWYDWKKLTALIQMYDAGNNSVVLEQLYFNRFFADRPAHNVKGEDDIYRFAVLDRDVTKNELRHAVGRKIWIFNTTEGWCPALDSFLAEHYGV